MTSDSPRNDSAPTRRRPSVAKVRLLDVADRLFYAEGIHTVGIDRIISEAGVTKATFYKQYGSKDALILAYIHGRDQQVRESLTTLAAAVEDAARILRTIVDAMVSDIARRDFRGCPFLAAAAEFPSPSHPVRVAITEHRDWVTAYLERRLQEMGHPEPGAAADEFLLLRDGAMSGGYAGDPVAATAALLRTADRVLGEAPSS